MPADPESNAAGFWESIDIAALNDRLLREFGRTWDDVRETPPLKVGDTALDSYRATALEILERDFGGSEPLAVIKDPRVCRLVPFWRGGAVEAGFEPRFLLVVRHPDEVAASLAKRDGLGEERAHQLWQRYLLDAEFTTRDALRTVVCFETLMSDWVSVARATARELELEWPHPPEQIGEAVTNFLSSRLRNHHHVPVDTPGGGSRGLYEVLRQAEGNVGDLFPRKMDEARQALDGEIAVHRAFLDEYQGSLLRCRSEVARRLDEIEDLRVGASSLEEWAEELAASLERANSDQARALTWVVESLFDGLGQAGPDPEVPLGTQLSLGLEATHRWRAEAKDRIGRAEKQLGRVREDLTQAREELVQAREELATERSNLGRERAEGQARVDALQVDLARVSAQEARSLDELACRDAALGELQSRFEELSDHAERLEAKVELVRRVPLAEWLWQLASRFRSEPSER